MITPVVKTIADSKESFWLKVPLYGVSFDEAGTYVVKFAMQQDGSNDTIQSSRRSKFNPNKKSELDIWFDLVL